MSKADAVAGDPLGRRRPSTPCSAAPTSAPGFWSLVAGGGERGERARRADRLGDRPGLGGQPRLADLRARRALDRVLGRLRGDHVDAVHPAQPRGARDRPARLGLRLPRGRARAARAAASPSACSASPRCSRRSSWAPWSARSPPAGCRSGNADGRPGDELAEPGLDPGRACCSSPPAPTWPRCS